LKLIVLSIIALKWPGRRERKDDRFVSRLASGKTPSSMQSLS
jgi:hypothetical protein